MIRPIEMFSLDEDQNNIIFLILLVNFLSRIRKKKKKTPSHLYFGCDGTTYFMLGRAEKCALFSIGRKVCKY